MQNAPHEIAATMLAARGQRYTPKRRTIVEVLAAAENPLTITELLGASANGGKALPQSSLYRNLTVLESAGVARRVVAVDEFSRFELSEAFTGHHHHLLCHTCGQVEDFELAEELESLLDTALDAVAKERGFELRQHRLDLVGECRACMESSEPHTADPESEESPAERGLH